MINNIDIIINKYIDEETRLEQLKASVQKKKAKRVELRGDSQRARQNYKNRLEHKKDEVNLATKKVKHYEKELDIKDKENKGKTGSLGIFKWFK